MHLMQNKGVLLEQLAPGKSTNSAPKTQKSFNDAIHIETKNLQIII